MKARFVWADGYVDRRQALNHAAWRRFRWDRDDVPVDRRLDLLTGCLIFLRTDGELVDVVEFTRVDCTDGSFEFREVGGRYREVGGR